MAYLSIKQGREHRGGAPWVGNEGRSGLFPPTAIRDTFWCAPLRVWKAGRPWMCRDGGKRSLCGAVKGMAVGCGVCVKLGV